MCASKTYASAFCSATPCPMFALFTLKYGISIAGNDKDYQITKLIYQLLLLLLRGVSMVHRMLHSYIAIK